MTGRLPREHGVRDNALFVLADREETLAEHVRAAGYRTMALVAASVLDRSTGIAQGFETFDDQVRVGPRDWFDWEERGASQVVDRAVELLDRLEPPYFLWVHFYDPHFPYIPPTSFRDRFKDRLYDGEIAFADAQLGRLLDELHRKKLDAALIVAVAGDHGESLGEHGERNHGVFVYQGTQRVPLILRGPGIPAGKVVAAPVGLADVAPTLLDLAGLPAMSAASGISLKKVIAGTTPVPVRDFELETHYPRQAFGWAPVRGLLRWPYKFILLPRVELYDVARDPAETDNLAAKDPGRVSELRRALAARLGPELDRPPGGESPPDPEQIERLRSLGYAAGAKPAPAYSTIDPKDGVAWMADLDRGRELGQRGRPREAVTVIGDVVRRNPENLEATLSLLNAQLATGDVARAVETGRAAVARWPDLYLAHFNLANALRGARDTVAAAEAEKEFRAALALFPRHAESVRGLAGLLLEQGRKKDARAVLDEALRRDVDDPDLALTRGDVCAALEDFDAADHAFARAAELDRTAGRPLEKRGQLAYVRGRKEDAARFYREALTRNPSAAAARTLGAILLNDLGDRNGARAAFQRSLQLEPRGREADAVRELLAGLK